jgi:hypothetical protein
MVATEIVNGTKGDLSLKEGNAGVYRDIKTLEADKKHTIEIDPNATYREYVVVSAPRGDKVFVTSDDCIDNSIIRIIVDDSGKYVFEAVPRGDTKTADPVQGGFFAKIFKKVFGRK